jgi:CRISPR-associated endonuclease/helicase Cas3
LDTSIGKLCLKEGDKYFQTLNGHTIDAIKILKQYIETNKFEVEEFCDRWDMDKSELYRNLFLMVYLHDIGKLTKDFQRNIKNNKRSNKFPHSFYAMGILDKVNVNDFVKLTILGHHSQLYGGLYNDYQIIKKTEYLIDNINKFLTNSYNVYNCLNFNEYFEFDGFNTIDIDKKAKPKKIWNALNDGLKSEYSEINLLNNRKEDIVKIKSIYCFMLSILKTADIYSSYNFERYILENNLKYDLFNDVLTNPEHYIPKLKKEYIPNFELYKYQNEIKHKAKKFQILFAPCGRGKTEASLLWAFEIMKKYNKNKIIFALPTQTTSNFMFDRLKKEFGKENVGIYHGMSFIKLKNDENNKKFDDFDNMDLDDEYEDYGAKLIKKVGDENFKGEIFHKPITITTIDHLIYSFIHGYKKSDFALGNIQNAVIIFDEVHYYEKTTLSHLYGLFDILKEMDIPHLLMSGTIPNFLNEKVNYDTIVDVEGLDYRPFRMFLNEYEIFDEKVFDSIINNYINGKTQFIILNTVSKSKKFYKILMDKLEDYGINPNVILYHSQFTHNDRNRKEKEIKEKYGNKNKKPFILVATQVIEISLDISADLMYSEVAPIDAIGQRGGRLNRKGRTPDGILNIYVPEKNVPYDKELMKNAEGILKKYDNNAISYGDIKKMCDELYKHYNLSGSNLKRFFNISTLFGYSHRDIRYSEDEGKFFKVRESKSLKIDVIPNSVYNNEENNLNVENIVKYPYYKYKNEAENGELIHFDIVYKKDKLYVICLHEYTYEFGFNDDIEMDEEFIDDDEFLGNLKNNNIVDNDIL